MSKVQLQGNASGTGIFTIASPNSNTDRTLTLPDNTGTLLSDSSTIVQSGGPAFGAWISAGGNTIASSTITIVPFDSKSGNSMRYDTAGCYNNTGSSTTLNGLTAPAYSFVPNVAGYYQVNTMVGIYSGSSGVAYVKLYLNGSAVANSNVIGFPAAANEVSPVCSTLIYLNGTGDYVQVYALQNAGATLNFDPQSWSYFNATLVRKA